MFTYTMRRDVGADAVIVERDGREAARFTASYRGWIKAEILAAEDIDTRRQIDVIVAARAASS